MSKGASDPSAPFKHGYYDPPGAPRATRKVTAPTTPAEASAFKQLEAEEKLAVIARAEQRTVSIDSSPMARNLGRAGSVLVGLIGASGLVTHVVGQLTGDTAEGSFPWGAFLTGGIALVAVLLVIIAISSDTRRTARARARVEMYRAIAALPDKGDSGNDRRTGDVGEE